MLNAQQRVHWVGQVDVALRYYLHVDPTLLSDTAWASCFKELVRIRKQEVGN